MRYVLDQLKNKFGFSQMMIKKELYFGKIIFLQKWINICNIGDNYIYSLSPVINGIF
jgi:hypothetical protein